MKTFNLKSKVIVVVAALGFAVSANAANDKVSYEQMVESFVIAQGQQMMADLADNLQQSISAQLQDFSLNNVTTLTVKANNGSKLKSTAKPQQADNSTTAED